MRFEDLILTRNIVNVKRILTFIIIENYQVIQNKKHTLKNVLLMFVWNYFNNEWRDKTN